MRCNPVVLAPVLLACLMTCGDPGANLREPGPAGKKLPTLLRPVAAVIHENGGNQVAAEEVMIKSSPGSPFEFKGAQFINGKKGWARTEKSLYQTSDGGKTWRRLPLNMPQHSRIYSLFFIDEERGWLAEVTQVDNERYGLGYSSRIMVTEDGGKSWSEQKNFPDEVNISEIKFLNANDGLAVGARVIDHRPPYDEIFVLTTSNGGRVWNNISDGVKAAIRNDSGIANDTGSGIHWSSKSNIFLLTRNGRVVSSTDQGRTWNMLVEFQDVRPDGSNSSTGYYKLLLDPKEQIRVIAGASGDEGHWGDLIVKDEQSSWSSYELLRTPIRDAVFLTNKELVACGQQIRPFDEKPNQPDAGIILHSLDSGRSWVPIYRSKLNEMFISLARISDNDFFAVSDRGTFLHFSLIRK